MTVTERLAAFFRWLGTPIRAVRGLFPFTHDGRQTLIYLMCALSAPVLTIAVMWLEDTAATQGQWAEHREIARLVAYSLLITSCAFSMFVAFRSLSLGSKDGLLNLSSKDDDHREVEAARKVEEKVTTAAAAAVEEVAANSPPQAQAPPAPDAGLPEGLR